MCKLDGRENDLFGLFLGARFDHHDAVLVTDNHDVQRGSCSLGIGGVDDEFTVHTAHAHRTNGRAEGNIGQRQRSGCCIDANHVRIVFFVGGEHQRDDLCLVAEALGKQRADGTVNLAASKDFLLAGPAFTLDEAAGDAAACVGVLAVVHSEGEEIDALAGIGGGDRGGQHHSLAGRDQRGTRSLLGHAPGLKYQPLAAGKLDSYFMLRRHSVLVSFCSLGKLLGGMRLRGAGQPAIRRASARCARDKVRLRGARSR